MKFKKTKKEKAEQKASKIYNDIIDKVDNHGKAVLTLERTDFKKDLSTSCGFGYQDLKKIYRLVAQRVIADGYKFNMKPLLDGGMEDFKLEITIK
jgi:hypothetical protein